MVHGKSEKVWGPSLAQLLGSQGWVPCRKVQLFNSSVKVQIWNEFVKRFRTSQRSQETSSLTQFGPAAGTQVWRWRWLWESFHCGAVLLKKQNKTRNGSDNQRIKDRDSGSCALTLMDQTQWHNVLWRHFLYWICLWRLKELHASFFYFNCFVGSHFVIILQINLIYWS